MLTARLPAPGPFLSEEVLETRAFSVPAGTAWTGASIASFCGAAAGPITSAEGSRTLSGTMTSGSAGAASEDEGGVAGWADAPADAADSRRAASTKRVLVMVRI